MIPAAGLVHGKYYSGSPDILIIDAQRLKSFQELFGKWPGDAPSLEGYPGQGANRRCLEVFPAPRVLSVKRR